MRLQLSLVVLAATQLGATDCGEVIRDAGFDVWCGDVLCTWKVVRGDVRRVDTWHAGDSGVELVGEDAAISQLAPVDYIDGTCLDFTLVANVTLDAEARLAIDVYGDGSIEHAERIPTASWKPIFIRLRLAKPFTGIRFELTKRGTGTAAFANIGARVVEASRCDGLPEIATGAAPEGALCDANAQCETGICRVVADAGALFGFSSRCTACDAANCGAGNLCAVGEPVSPVLAVPLRCEPAGSAELGELCAADAECESGSCTGGACSTCRTACPGGETCAPAWLHGPSVCSPGAGVRGSGEPCVTHTDCASGACNGGERAVCARDGRPCTSDIQCPVEADLVPGTCTKVGVTGGSCQ